jgi:hypothetical protein
VKRNLALPIAIAIIVFGRLVSPDTTTSAQEKKTIAPQKIASIDYLVGTWSCAHTVGTFSGKYTTTYTKVLGNLAQTDVRLSPDAIRGPHPASGNGGSSHRVRRGLGSVGALLRQ